MKEPTPELIAEINALQSMCTEEIRKRYAALLGVDLERCMNCSELRAGIAYNAEERKFRVHVRRRSRLSRFGFVSCRSWCRDLLHE